MSQTITLEWDGDELTEEDVERLKHTLRIFLVRHAFSLSNPVRGTVKVDDRVTYRWDEHGVKYG
jgi:hypothetical protein